MQDLSPSQWSIAEKIAFRFFFIFFGLFIAFHNNGAYPFFDLLFEYPTELLHVIIPWIGKHILRLSYDITVFTNGSGDTTYDYVIVFACAMLGLIGTVVWSILDRKRANYDTLYYWLTAAIRFYVGLMLIQYGMVKVIKLQFSSPGFYRLTQPYGDSSPMGLAWTFLGFSKGYNMFMGLAEMAAGLLLFRRTLALGAIITLATAANVMAVNFFYDVPVKIVSTALVVMTLFLLLRDAKRLFTFFFTGRAIALPVIKAPVISQRWLRITKLSFKALILGYALIYGLYETIESGKEYGENAPKPALHGLYTVDTYIVNQDTIPPLMTDSTRWKQVLIEWEGYARVNYMNDKRAFYASEVDTTAHTLILTSTQDSTLQYNFSYELPSPDQFHLRGTLEDDTLSILMHRKGIKDFLLTNRGFHWVSEYPFNR